MLCCRNENQDYEKRNHVPVRTTKAVLSLQVGGVPLKQSNRFEYLGVSFTSDSRENSELDIRIEKANAVMRQIHQSVVLKRELCTKAKPSIFRSVYVTYGHEYWVMHEKVRSRVQAAEMRFLRRISGLTLLDKVKMQIFVKLYTWNCCFSD